MTNIRPIWSPRDSIDTAHQFHLELHNAERGVPERKSRLFSVSRERKARRMDALAVALLLIVMAAFGVIVMLLSTPQAKADPDSMVYAYAATFGSAVCETLDSYPSFGGIYGIADAITDDGLTYYQAGQVIIPSYLHPGAFHAVCESCAWRSPFSSEERAYHMVETHQQAMKARRRKR